MADKTPPSDDWWTALYGDDHQPEPEKTPGPYERITHYVIHERHTDPEERKNRKAAQLAFNGAAAGLGWATGYVPALTDVLHDVGEIGTGGAIVIGTGFVIVATIADRYGRHAARLLPEPVQPVVRFLARVPLAGAVLALCLFSPGYWSAP
ncbi:hypothetical protein [Streptomyces macrosporus]|uniref:MFS transporter n=1 Tax=Streptomyces macrosporus TaxID=44032 RepID=A0ABP5XJS7_9ACTN